MNKDFAKLIKKIKGEQQKLIEDIKASDPAVRRKAAIQLGSEGIEETVPFLVPLLKDENKGVREAVVEALVNIGGEGIIQDLIPFLRVRDASVRNAAVEIMMSIAEDSIDSLVPLLKDGDKDIRIFAADILGSSKKLAAPKYLIETLGDKNPNVRNAVVMSLGKLKAGQATSALLELLQYEEEEWVIFSTIESLVQIGDNITSCLVNLLDNEKELVLSVVTEALAKTGDLTAVLPLLKKAAFATDKLGGAIAGVLIEILKEQDLEFLETETADKLESFLIELTSSEADSWMRYHAIELLGKLKAKNAVNLLLKNLKTKDSFLKIASIKALSMIEGKENFSALEALVHDNDANVRQVAQVSLQELKKK